MKHMIIKILKNFCYLNTRFTNFILNKIRHNCDHPQKSRVDYMWRVGCIQKADVCDICGEAFSPFNESEWVIKNNEHVNEATDNG